MTINERAEIGTGPGSDGSGPEADWTVEDHLHGHSTESIELYRRFVDIVAACGPFTYAVSKSIVTFKGSRRGFAGARPARFGLTGYLDLQHAVEDPRFTSASPYTKRLFVHKMRIISSEQFDADFSVWVREAYDVGQGAHLER